MARCDQRRRPEVYALSHNRRAVAAASDLTKDRSNDGYPASISPPAEPEGGLRRNLKKRHLLMMSLGGTISAPAYLSALPEPRSCCRAGGNLTGLSVCRPLCWRIDDVLANYHAPFLTPVHFNITR